MRVSVNAKRNNNKVNCTRAHGRHRVLILPIGTLSETSLPDKEPLLNDLARVTRSIRAWRNVVETIHPSDRKKRIAREVDTMMREEINNPIGEIGATIWSTAVSEARVRDRDECMKSNMMSSPGVLDNAEEESDDYITALPSILAHQLGQTPPKKRGKTLTKRKVRGSKHE
jgi:hypothetical protein